MNSEGDPALVLRSVAELLESASVAEARRLLEEQYPFEKPKNPGRSYTPKQMTGIFCRDGFVDRFSGRRLVFPPVMRLITEFLPEHFPAHKNWKMSETHQAYYDLFPTIDHLEPVARGGADEPSNWYTTSMARNAAKGNFRLDDLGWTLHEPGQMVEWDGLTGWFLRHLDQHPDGHSAYIKTWERALRTVLSGPDR
jgi:hypothetical protein